MLPVDVGQAGRKVVCSCGTTLDVPTLRMLRHLPPAPTDQAKPAAWSPRKGAIAVFVIAAGLLTAASLWNWLTEPIVPEFQPQAQAQMVNEQLNQMKPVDAWKTWILVYRPLTEAGFTPLESRDAPRIRAAIEHKRFLECSMLSIAGVCLGIAALAALWPAGNRKRAR